MTLLPTAKNAHKTGKNLSESEIHTMYRTGEGSNASVEALQFSEEYRLEQLDIAVHELLPQYSDATYRTVLGENPSQKLHENKEFFTVFLPGKNDSIFSYGYLKDEYQFGGETYPPGWYFDKIRPRTKGDQIGGGVPYTEDEYILYLDLYKVYPQISEFAGDNNPARYLSWILMGCGNPCMPPRPPFMGLGSNNSTNNSDTFVSSDQYQPAYNGSSGWYVQTNWGYSNCCGCGCYQAPMYYNYCGGTYYNQWGNSCGWAPSQPYYVDNSSVVYVYEGDTYITITDSFNDSYSDDDTIVYEDDGDDDNPDDGNPDDGGGPPGDVPNGDDNGGGPSGDVPNGTGGGGVVGDVSDGGRSTAQDAWTQALLAERQDRISSGTTSHTPNQTNTQTTFSDSGVPQNTQTTEKVPSSFGSGNSHRPTQQYSHSQVPVLDGSSGDVMANNQRLPNNVPPQQRPSVESIPSGQQGRNNDMVSMIPQGTSSPARVPQTDVFSPARTPQQSQNNGGANEPIRRNPNNVSFIQQNGNGGQTPSQPSLSSNARYQNNGGSGRMSGGLPTRATRR